MVLAFSLTLSVAARDTQAGVFNLPHFVTPGEFAMGFEPELYFSNGSGVGTNVKYTQGLTDLINVTGIIGTGGGPRGFRAGASFMLDFFPDIEGQPGIGLGGQSLYYRVSDLGVLELTAIPYIHKTIISSGHEVEPFFALPIGFAFSNGEYQNTSTAVVGAMFKTWDRVRTTLEFGVAINHAETYFSGGFTYYHQ